MAGVVHGGREKLTAGAGCHCHRCGQRAGPGLVESALQHFGRLDIVIANAGIDRAGSFHKQGLAEFAHVFDVNFFAVARLLHARLAGE
ncbi:MAG: SDR family NAD(P)-dependent oxidoreductase [Halioglobus sp.]|nr:SDR family NAD(P)-dependent oxidoreductase [Halioglobus sp.]